MPNSSSVQLCSSFRVNNRTDLSVPLVKTSSLDLYTLSIAQSLNRGSLNKRLSENRLKDGLPKDICMMIRLNKLYIDTS